MDLVGNVLIAIATVLSVVVANTLTFSRSSKQKFWDLRRQTYGAILSELATVERLCRHADDLIAEDESRYFHGDQTQSGLIGERMHAVRQRFSDDYLILSEDFIGVFERFLDELAACVPDAIPPEEHEHFVAALRKFRPQLMAQARREISVRRRLPFRFG